MAGYRKAADEIAARIASGALAPGAQLGSERQLSDELKVSRLTLRAALGKLEADGMIYGMSRRGWFVSPPRFVYELDRRANYKLMAEAQGRSARIELLDAGSVSADGIPECLRVPPAPSAFFLQRVRHLDGRPVMFETVYLSAAVVPGLLDHTLSDSITALLAEEYQIEIEREETSVRSALLDTDQSTALSVAPATHSVLIERKRFSSGRLVEFDTEHWLPGAIEIRLTANL